MKTKPRLLSVSLAAVLSVSLLAVQPASALTVFDPSNFVQNTLTAVRTLEQINNQINQLQNEAQMLMNQPGTGKSRLQHRQPPALDARHHRAPDRRGARLGLRRAEHGCHVRPPVPGTVRRHHQRRPHGTGRPRTLAEHLERLAHRDADAGAGVAEPRPRRKRAGRSREPEPVGHRRAASDAGDEPAPGFAGQAVDPGAAAPDHARPGRFTGTGAASGGYGARPRSAAALSGHRHAVHAAVRQLL